MSAYNIMKTDPELAKALEKEQERQQYTLELIASENIVSLSVMAIQGSVLTNKYAEGYPDKRYYGGCEFVDLAEDLANHTVPGRLDGVLHLHGFHNQ